MRLAFRTVNRFVCFSRMERSLYAAHFDLDIDRIDMIHWAARRPPTDPRAEAIVAGAYICAIGSQGRDYATLIAAMKLLPQIRLIVVTTPESVAGLSLPENVEIRCNIPLHQAMNVLQHSRFSVIPLRGSEVPCGHVTIVSAMHLEKATIVTDSSGVADYVEDGVNGLTVPVGDARAMASAIDRLWNEPAHCSLLGQAAVAFARTSCSEQSAANYFEGYLRRHVTS